MKPNITSLYQSGQSMIEYTVVLAFGVLVLIADPDGTGSPIVKLTKRITEHYEGYSYAISLSDYPDADNPIALNTLYEGAIPDDLRLYLIDYPDGVVSALLNYDGGGAFPSMQTGIDMVNEGFSLF